MLKPRDLLVVLKIAVAEPGWTYAQLAEQLGLSSSRVHDSVKRSVAAGLLLEPHKVSRRALRDFLLYGVRYAFYPERGAVTRGTPTAYAASPLKDKLASDGLPIVWPDPDGAVRGEAIEPLDKCAPEAARKDARLYELLVLVDALRVGRARDRRIAADLLEKALAN